jgi:DNA-directed RNA polymerase specialized sigma24 family protein
VVTNRIINEGQRKANAGRASVVGDLMDGSTLQGLESRIVSGRYETVLARCMKEACANLSVRERMILLWRFEQERQLGEIADLLGVHQSTITRTVERIARKLKQDMIASLRNHQLDGAAIEECIWVLLEGNDHCISILDYIREAKPEETAPQLETGARA